MTVMATGTFARADCASMRSAMFFANASKSMTVSFLMRVARKGKLRATIASASMGELPQIDSQAIFCVSGLMKSLREKRLDPSLRSRSRDRGHARVPAGSDLDIRRQAGGIHEALGVCDRPFVKRGDAPRQRVDVAIELPVRQGPVYIAIGFGEVAADVIGAQQHLQGPLPAHLPRQTRHRPAARDQPNAHF